MINDWHELNKHHIWEHIGAIAYTAAANYLGGDQARNENNKNRQHANRQQEWQGMMSSTAHTREVADLKNAGLNPTLSAGGDGSSTPSGTSSQNSMPPIELPGVMDIVGMHQQQQKIDNETKLADANIAKNLDERQILKMKKVLMQRGSGLAEIEGGIVNTIKKYYKIINDAEQQRKSRQPNPLNSMPLNEMPKDPWGMP